MSHDEAMAEMDRQANEAKVGSSRQAADERKRDLKQQPGSSAVNEPALGRRQEEVDADLRELERLEELRRKREEHAKQQPAPDALKPVDLQPSARQAEQHEPSGHSSGHSADDSIAGFVYFFRKGNVCGISAAQHLLQSIEQFQPDEVLNVIRCVNYAEVEEEMRRKLYYLRLPQSDYYRLSASQIHEVDQMLIKLSIS